MTGPLLGVILALVFVVLESLQFVFFGGLFQRMSSFLFGFLVFGSTIIGFVAWTALRDPDQIRRAFANRAALIGVNMSAVFAFTSYLMSVQLVEPAITYTISAGTMPVTTYILYRFGVPEGEAMRNRMEGAGNVLLFAGILYLAWVTIAGFTGFVRGDWHAAMAGVLLAVADGVFFTMVLVYSQRLSVSGVGPGAVLGLRLPLYVLVAGGCVALEVDHKETLEASEIAIYGLIGLVLTVPPLYTLQKAISLISTLTISALTALGPFIIFGLQMFEGRVGYATATLIGLSIYFVGSLLSAIGAVKSTA
jgi:drug/metabolite transporter (DMT)-like permease